MKTISAEQFKKQFGEDVYNSFGTTPKKDPGYLQRLGKSFEKTSLDIGEGIYEQSKVIGEGMEAGKRGDLFGGLQKTSQGVVRAGLRGAGGFSKIALSPVMEAPGIKQATEFIGENLAKTTPIQKYMEWSQKHPEAAKDIENVLDITALVGATKAVQAAIPKVKAGVKTGVKTVVGTPPPDGGSGTGILGAVGKVKTLTKNAPENIMNRVARLNPTDEIKFTKITGKSPGKYLTDTGNFGNPQDIITKESLKFIQSKDLVDDALSKLPGEYKLKPINTALEEIIKKGQKVSSPGAEAGYLSTAKQLLEKSKSQGLSMAEINGVKRLFEREVKLGYNKTLNPDLIDKATRIDGAIRQWQFSKADYLGFKNIAQMNKQTQISKFLVDKLGNKIVGQQALNNVTLTDWIMLSGGNPASVGGFLTKKFFSSKAAQARIAKILSGNKSTMAFPETSLTPEYLKKQALPQGKPAGEYPIIPKAPTTYESQAPIKKLKK